MTERRAEGESTNLWMSRALESYATKEDLGDVKAEIAELRGRFSMFAWISGAMLVSLIGLTIFLVRDALSR